MHPTITVNDFTQNNEAYGGICVSTSWCVATVYMSALLHRLLHSKMLKVFLCSSDKLSQFVFHFVSQYNAFVYFTFYHCLNVKKKKYPILVKKQNKQVCWAEALYYLLSAQLVHNREASAHYFKLKPWNIENKIKPKLGAFTFYNKHGWQKQFTTIQNQLHLKLHLKVDHEKLVKEQSSLSLFALRSNYTTPYFVSRVRLSVANVMHLKFRL